LTNTGKRGRDGVRRTIWGIPIPRRRRHGEKSGTAIGETLHGWTAAVMRLLGAVLSGSLLRSRSTAFPPEPRPAATAADLSESEGRASVQPSVPPHLVDDDGHHPWSDQPLHDSRLPRSAASDALRTLGRPRASERRRQRAYDVLYALSPLAAEFFSTRPAAARAAALELRLRLRREIEFLALRRLVPTWEEAAWKEVQRPEGGGSNADWQEIAEAAAAASAGPIKP